MGHESEQNTSVAVWSAAVDCLAGILCRTSIPGNNPRDSVGKPKSATAAAGPAAVEEILCCGGGGGAGGGPRPASAAAFARAALVRAGVLPGVEIQPCLGFCARTADPGDLEKVALAAARATVGMSVAGKARLLLEGLTSMQVGYLPG